MEWERESVLNTVHLPKKLQKIPKQSRVIEGVEGFCTANYGAESYWIIFDLHI